jgi:hypothetical protein
LADAYGVGDELCRLPALPRAVNSSGVPTLEQSRFTEIVEFLIVLQVLQKYNGSWLLIYLHKKAAFGQIINLRVSPLHCANMTLNSYWPARGGAAGAPAGWGDGDGKGRRWGDGCLP